MPWVESASRTFRARHDSARAQDADRVLDSLERTRERLAELFTHDVGEITIVLHRDTLSLSLANPTWPLRWLATAPAARRYVAGWVRPTELHMLAPAALEARASNVRGSREMLELTAAALYTRRLINENNRDLQRSIAPARIASELRWAWLLEGGARWFSGQTEHARPAIGRRLHEGRRPRFPPGVRDAALLGGTVIDLLAQEYGELAAAQFVCRLHPDGPRAALRKAFSGIELVHIEGAWRSHLARMVG